MEIVLPHRRCARRTVRRSVDRDGRCDLPRGLPDQPADRLTVHRSVGGPAGTQAGPRCWTAELDRERAPSVVEAAGLHVVCRSTRVRDQAGGQHPCVHDVEGATDQLEGQADDLVRCWGAVSGGHDAALPDSTIYGFNGTFPGPRINAEYGKPVIVRFQNHLDENPLNLDRQDFGSPDWSFLTHLHNGHTAPESDGNPLLDEVWPQAPRLLPGPVGRQPVPQLACRRGRAREAELLLVPRSPRGPHRIQRVQRHGRPNTPFSINFNK